MSVAGAYTEAAGAAAMSRLVDATTDFTAVMAGNDLIALGVLAVLAERGIRCPQDVSVVGFNDLPMVDKLSPPLTTVRLPLNAIGAMAARILLGEMEGVPTEGALAQSLLNVELAVRGSTAPPSSARRRPGLERLQEADQPGEVVLRVVELGRGGCRPGSAGSGPAAAARTSSACAPGSIVSWVAPMTSVGTSMCRQIPPSGPSPRGCR